MPEKAARLHIAMVSSEILPFAKTGGLADMVAGLVRALEKLGHTVSLILPAYRSVLRGNFAHEDRGGMGFSVPVARRSEAATVLKSTMGKAISVYFIRADKYFDRDHLYATAAGDYPDNAERFVFFCRAALEVLKQDPPEILHCHDWQSALTIAFLKAQPDRYPQLSSAKSVFTVHNPGYQGLFSHEEWPLLNLDPSLFSPEAMEFYGKINFLKGGLVFGDTITTVSPTYAEEIKTPEQGFGLEGVFRKRATDLVGILNGVDYALWNPETDPFIAQNYSGKNLSGKKVCKAALQRELSLVENPDVPLFGMISRLTSQKGLDLVEKSWDDLLSRNLQWVLLGTGEKNYEASFQRLASRRPGKAALRIGFDEGLAHRIEAGSDFFLMPSLYEPCGLNQIYSLKYGTIPVVRATGGLKDTVKDHNQKNPVGNGFVFEPHEPKALLEAVDRGIELFRRKGSWTALIKRAMAADFSWARSAEAYARLYRRLLP